MVAGDGRMASLALLGFLAVASGAPSARAQGNVFNPYGNSGYADYREFASPVANNNPSLPGQARLQGESIGSPFRAGGPNQFDSFLNSLNANDTSLGTRNGQGAAGRGVPYFRASRIAADQGRNSYRPNDTEANRKFEERMKRRDALYAKALQEKDPVRRAVLLRQAERDAVDRPLATAPAASRAVRTPAAPTSRTPSPAASTSTSTSPARRSAAPAASRPAATAPARTTAPTIPPASTDPSSVPIPPPR